jgi:hypothetical protein
MAAVVALVVRGRLIPRSWVENLLAEKDARLEWQETALTEQRATIASLVQQNAELTVSGRLSVALLQSIQPPSTISASTTNPGSGHVAPTSVEP